MGEVPPDVAEHKWEFLDAAAPRSVVIESIVVFSHFVDDALALSCGFLLSVECLEDSCDLLAAQRANHLLHHISLVDGDQTCSTEGMPACGRHFELLRLIQTD